MVNDLSRNDIISTLDDIIEKVQNLRGIMLGVSLSALVLAPFAIVISIYLATHPHFLVVIESENEFGFVLIVLLVGILTISGMWLYTGIKQFRTLSGWNKRYRKYLNKREQLDSEISSEYGLGHDE